MTEHQVLVKGLNINYKIFPARNASHSDAGGGEGKPFLVLHGWGSSSDRWQKVGELLEKNFKVIVPDLPGFGKSQEQAWAWNLDTYVEWLNEFSNNVPELKNGFYLLGHSFGGALSIKFSIKYVQKVEKLFLIGVAAIRKRTIKKQVLGQTSKFIKVFSFLPFYSVAKKAFYKFVVGSDDYLSSRGIMKETFLKVISEDLSNHVTFVRVPTVIIWGDKDDATLVEDAYFIHKKIEHSKLVIIPGADHIFYHTTPEVLVEYILENA